MVGPVCEIDDRSIFNNGIAEIQIRAALAKGELSIEQVEEIRVFMVNYVGHPRIANFSAAMARAIAAHREQNGG